MNLKIHCDYKKQKIRISSDAQYIRTVLMILDVFNRPKRNRYLFLSLLGLLILSVIAAGKVTNFYVCYEPVIVLVVTLLACCICRQGPPTLFLKHHYFPFKSKELLNMDKDNIVVVDFDKNSKKLEKEAIDIYVKMIYRLYLELEDTHGHSGNVA